MQLNMVTPMDLGLERQDGIDDSDMFDLGEVEGTTSRSRLGPRKGVQGAFADDEIMESGDEGSDELEGIDEEEEEEDDGLDDEERKTDPAGWLRGLRKQHEVSASPHFNFCSSSTDNRMITSQNAMNRIRDRKKKKEQLTDRKSLAAQQRMKSIATLASEVNVGKKRKRGVAGAFLQLAIYIR